MTPRRSSLPVIVCIAALLVPVGAYVGGYFLFGEYKEVGNLGTYRIFANAPLKALYLPLVKVEGRVRRIDLVGVTEDEWQQMWSQ
jgi:hypothetical protein